MNIKYILVFFSLLSSFAFAQDSNKLYLEIRYPLPIDNNFVGDNYTGIYDLGAKYYLFTKSDFTIGASLHSGLLRSSSSVENPYNINAFTVQPGFFVSYYTDKLGPFKPYLGGGFTTIRFKAKLDKKYSFGFSESESSSTQNGFHFNVGTTCNLFNKFYMHAQYEFIKLRLSDVPDIPYNTNIGLLKIGFGYTI